MKIRDIRIEELAAGKNWRVHAGSGGTSLVDLEIDECSDLRADETVAYSALAVFATGEVRPLLLVREVGTYEWWRDTCEYVDGIWVELQPSSEWSGAETYVAAPLSNDPSFTGEDSEKKQALASLDGAIGCSEADDALSPTGGDPGFAWHVDTTRTDHPPDEDRVLVSRLNGALIGSLSRRRSCAHSWREQSPLWRH